MEKAVRTLSGKFDFEIAYYPFELNSKMPVEGLDQKEYLSKKFGDESEYERLTSHVTEIAEQEGLTFNFDKQLVSPNTRHAHRLIMIAKESGKHAEIVEALFKAYFTDGVDLTKKENLLNVAESVGMNRASTEIFLNSDSGTTEVAVAENELKKIGITGVPFYIVNDKFGISGAQSSQTFIEAFENIGDELASSGDACEVGEC
jgi:predicted DsbA family dithiol-disulfide isomerase